MSKKVVETVTNDVTIWRIRVACWISKATRTYAHAHAHAPAYPYARTHKQNNNTYCFSTDTMIHERASMLRYTYIAPLVWPAKHQISCELRMLREDCHQFCPPKRIHVLP